MVKTFEVDLTMSSGIEVTALVEVLFDAWKDFNGRKDVWDWQVLKYEVWIEGQNTVLLKDEKERLDKIIDKKMESVDFRDFYSKYFCA